MNSEITNQASFNKGSSLVELMIAAAIISVGFLAFIASYAAISTSISFSKARTLASNFAQEKIEYLKSQDYYKIIPTPSVQYDNSVTPPAPYDNTYFPPQYITSSGHTYTRYTYVENVYDVNGTLTYSPPNTDNGIKRITISVLWKEGSTTKSMTLQNIVSNPSMVMYSANLSGKVMIAGGSTPIQYAQVVITNDTGWQDITDASGNYSIQVVPGQYIINVSADRFFSSSLQTTVSQGTNQTNDFYLTPMSSGTIKGTVWLDNHVVISQVVASTTSPQGFQQEYVELYNPTTSYFSIVSGGVKQILLNYQQNSGPFTNINLNYAVAESSIPPNSYYLISNTTTVNVFGLNIPADAVYDPSMGTNVIIKNKAAGVNICWVSNNAAIDAVGWTKNSASQTPPIYENTAIPNTGGFSDNEQFVRRSSTGGFTAGYGRCYDSNNNAVDFVDFPIMSMAPRNSSFSEPPLTGTPAFGAIISVSDGLSCATTAYAVCSSSVPWAEFCLTSVATGTWTVVFTSSGYYAEIMNVTVTPSSLSWIPNSVTSSSWPAVNCYNTLLSNKTGFGFVSGRITDGFNNPISPMSATAATTAPTSALGYYFVTANPERHGNSEPRQRQHGIHIANADGERRGGRGHFGNRFRALAGRQSTGFCVKGRHKRASRCRGKRL